MDKATKEKLVSQIHSQFNDATIAILTDFRGLDVESITKLRQDLRHENISYRVVKNTLAKLAVKGTSSEVLENEFHGTVGVAFGYADPTIAPRILVDYTKDNDKLVLKVASFAGQKIDLHKIKALAALPSREVLLTQLAGLLIAPLRNMATCLAGVPRNFLNCMVALKNKKEKGET